MNVMPEWTHLEVIVASALVATTVMTTVSVVVCGAVFALTGGLRRVPKAVATPVRPTAVPTGAVPSVFVPAV